MQKTSKQQERQPQEQGTIQRFGELKQTQYLCLKNIVDRQ